MGIAVTLDDKLVEEAKRLTGLDGDSAAVEQVLKAALAERGGSKSMFDLIGKVRLRDDYDYKALRAGDGNPD